MAVSGVPRAAHEAGVVKPFVLRRTLQRHLQQLVFKENTEDCVSCFLNVDGRVRPRADDYMTALRELTHAALSTAARRDATAADAVQRSMHQIETWIERNFVRSITRGLAFFVSSNAGFFRVLEIPVAVDDEVAVSNRPRVMQLAKIDSRTKRFAVALVDSRRLRIFDSELGELHEYDALISPERPHHQLQRGWNIAGSDAGTNGATTYWMPAGSHADRRKLNLYIHHIADAAVAVTTHLGSHPAEYVLIGGPELERIHLGRALRLWSNTNVAAYLPLRADCAYGEVKRAVEAAATDITTAIDDEIFEELNDRSGRDETVFGLPAVLDLISENRAQSLVFQREVNARPGGICTWCRRLATHDGVCAACGAPIDRVDDVVEALVERAIQSGVKLSFIGGADRRLGGDGLAAIARFALKSAAI